MFGRQTSLLFFGGLVVVSLYCSYNVIEYVASRSTDLPKPKRPQIFCYLLTHTANFDTFARAAQQAWATKCDVHRFIALVNNGSAQAFETMVGPLPVLQPGGMLNESYGRLSDKVFGAMHDIYQTYGHYDWYLKADDNTFVLVDNLRRFLADKNQSAPVTYGFNFKLYVEMGYQSGGAGYVLSNEAFRRLGVELARNSSFCDKSTGVEDYEVAKCLRKTGVVPGNSTDHMGLERFHPIDPVHHYEGDLPDWIFEYAQNPVQVRSGFINLNNLQGLNCCSDSSISFHYLSEADMIKLGKIVDNSSTSTTHQSFRELLTQLTDNKYNFSTTPSHSNDDHADTTTQS